MTASENEASGTARDVVAEIVGRLGAERVVELSAEASAALLEIAVRVSEEDTVLSGPIRVLDLGGRILVQERSGKGEILVRELPSVDAARAFVAARLAAYERMWDG